jgi:hypothetical protein
MRWLIFAWHLLAAAWMTARYLFKSIRASDKESRQVRRFRDWDSWH